MPSCFVRLSLSFHPSGDVNGGGEIALNLGNIVFDLLEIKFKKKKNYETLNILQPTASIAIRPRDVFWLKKSL